MRHLYSLCFLLSTFSVDAQVFMKPFDNAAAISLGGAVIAYPGLAAGLSNEALSGFGGKAGVYLGSVIPHGISGWQVAQFQGHTRIDENSGVGLEAIHSGVELYREQRFRLMYARRLGNNFYLGGSGGLLRVSAQEYGSANGIAYGIGFLAGVSQNVWIGGNIQNPFPQKIGAEETSGVLRIGAAWKTSEILILMAETEKMLDRPAQIKAGMEYRPVNVLVIRAGLRTGSAARIGFGAGVRLKNGLALDAGSEWHPSLGITPAAMIVWQKP